MNTLPRTIEELIAALQAIAKKNDDEFSFRMEFEFRKGAIWYHFICEETADHHTFVDGSGFSIDTAVDDAISSIADACKQWGYKQ